MEEKSKKLIARLLMVLVFALASVLTANFNLKGLAVVPAQAEDGESEDEEDSDDNEDEDKDDEGDEDEKDNDNDNDDDEDDQEDESERLRPTLNRTAVPGFEDEDEDEADDEDEDENEVVTKTTVNNPDGTRTEVTTKVDGDETKVTELTYDQNGNLIMKKQTEQEGVKGEVKTTTYDIYGNKLSQVEMKTLDGQIIKIESDDEEDGDDAEADGVEMKYDAQNQRLIIESEQGDAESRLVIAVDGDNFTITQAGYRAAADFPMTVDEATGAITIQTSAGPIALKALPGTIVQSALNSGEINVISGTDIEESDHKIVYTLTGTKFEKLLGIFTVEIPVEVEYDGQSGQFMDSSTSFFSGILDIFSF